MADRWINTHCSRFDHGGCGFRVLVEDGRIKRYQPNPDDPFSSGYHCLKGRCAPQRLSDPKRLTQPLRRSGRRGEGRWQAVDWNEALDEIADRWQAVIREFGPEGLAFAQGSPKGPEFFVMVRLANLLRCPNLAGTQHVCHMPREQMAMVTCGFFPVADLDQPGQCLVVWGSNPPVTNEEGVLGTHLMAAAKAVESLIVVDPVPTDLARRADLWLQLRPGTDDALALGLLNVIIAEDLIDHDFVQRFTTGFADLRESVRPYDPDKVAAMCWVDPDKIVQAARIYASSRAAAMQLGNAIEHGANSCQTCRALFILMAVTGNLDVPGGNIRAQGPKLQRLREFIRLDQFPDRAAKLLNRHFGILPRLITVPNWMVVRSILDQSPYPIRTLYTQGTNPLVTYADTDTVRRALEQLDFVVVADQTMTPTAALADLVLPVALPLEYNDIGHYGLPHGYVLARPKAVDPPPGCWPDVKILGELGKRLGFADHFWDDPDQMLDDILAPSAMTYQDLVQRGVLRGKKRYRLHEDRGFSTPSKKVELRSSLLEKWGYDPLPGAREPLPVDDDFPLILTSRKPKNYFHSAYRHLERLRAKSPQPQVRIHPETAARYGIEEGAPVRIETAHGAIIQQARFMEGLDSRVIIADYGWWFPESGPRELFGCRRSNLNVLTSMDGPTDAIIGTTQMRALPCRIAPGA